MLKIIKIASLFSKKILFRIFSSLPTVRGSVPSQEFTAGVILRGLSLPFYKYRFLLNFLTKLLAFLITDLIILPILL